MSSSLLSKAWTEEALIVNGVVTAVFTLLPAVGLIGVLKLQHHSAIQHRHLKALLVSIFACVLAVLQAGLAPLYLDPFPCALNLVGFSIGINVSCGVTVWRLIDITFATVLTQERA